MNTARHSRRKLIRIPKTTRDRLAQGGTHKARNLYDRKDTRRVLKEEKEDA